MISILVWIDSTTVPNSGVFKIEPAMQVKSFRKRVQSVVKERKASAQTGPALDVDVVSLLSSADDPPSPAPVPDVFDEPDEEDEEEQDRQHCRIRCQSSHVCDPLAVLFASDGQRRERTVIVRIFLNAFFFFCGIRGALLAPGQR